MLAPPTDRACHIIRVTEIFWSK